VSAKTPVLQKDPGRLQLELARVRQLLPAIANSIRDIEPECHRRDALETVLSGHRRCGLHRRISVGVGGQAAPPRMMSDPSLMSPPKLGWLTLREKMREHLEDAMAAACQGILAAMDASTAMLYLHRPLYWAEREEEMLAGGRLWVASKPSMLARQDCPDPGGVVRPWREK
jgi:hypothetical protein